MGNTFKNSIFITCNKILPFPPKTEAFVLKKSENIFIARHAGIGSLEQQISREILGNIKSLILTDFDRQILS